MGKEFEVEKILAVAKGKKSNTYLIKWKGYSEKHNTWEPLSHLLPNAKSLLDEFHRQKNNPALNAKASQPATKKEIPKAKSPEKQKSPGKANAKKEKVKKSVLLKKSQRISKPAKIPIKLSRPGSYANKDKVSRIVTHKRINSNTKSRGQINYLVSWKDDDPKIFKRDSELSSDELRKNDSLLLFNYLEEKLV